MITSNDPEYLRYDPLLMLALEKLNFIDNEEKGLAGKSTLNRLEYCPEEVLKQSESRYHKIEMLPKEIEKAFIDIFLDSYQTPPESIVIDMDVTDDEVHGSQKGAFFNKYSQLKLRASQVIEKAENDYKSRVEIGEAFLDNQGFKKEELATIREVVPNAL